MYADMYSFLARRFMQAPAAAVEVEVCCNVFVFTVARWQMYRAFVRIYRAFLARRFVRAPATGCVAVAVDMRCNMCVYTMALLQMYRAFIRMYMSVCSTALHAGTYSCC